MNDFETIKAILERVDPEHNSWYTEPYADLQAIYFPADDEWYTTVLFFDANGQLKFIS